MAMQDASKKKKRLIKKKKKPNNIQAIIFVNWKIYYLSGGSKCHADRRRWLRSLYTKLPKLWPGDLYVVRVKMSYTVDTNLAPDRIPDDFLSGMSDFLCAMFDRPKRVSSKQVFFFFGKNYSWKPTRSFFKVNI